MIQDKIELALIRLKARAIQRREERKRRRRERVFERGLAKRVDKRIVHEYCRGAKTCQIDYPPAYRQNVIDRLQHYKRIGLIDKYDEDFGKAEIIFNK